MTSQWWELLEQIERHPGLTFVLGAAHSGKSTLAKFLVTRISQRRHVTAYLDGDMGQSTLGPPAALNLALLQYPFEPTREPLENKDALVVARYFIGSNAPGGHFLPLLVGLRKLTQRARQLGAEMVILDSTGFVSGGAARELKFQKIDLLSPQHLVALQHAGELEPILQPLEGRPGMRIHRLPVHPLARPKTLEERQANRSHKYSEYFRGRRLAGFNLQKIRVIGNASPLETYSSSACADLKGLLVGLNDAENFTLGMGILSHLDPRKGKITLWTPLSPLSGVRILRLGALKLDSSWRDHSWRPY
ncbi:MAG: hypothetical protein HYS70_04605 [Nitrospinae bacterium]|nr:hypothetical protein [Nitrospinota bacterium]